MKLCKGLLTRASPILPETAVNPREPQKQTSNSFGTHQFLNHQTLHLVGIEFKFCFYSPHTPGLCLCLLPDPLWNYRTIVLW